MTTSRSRGGWGGRLVHHGRTLLFHGLRPVVARLFHVWIKAAERRRVGPFEVVVLSGQPVEQHLARIGEAADLIRRYDHVRYQRVVRGIRMVVVADRPTEAEYFDFADAVVVQARLLRIIDLDGLAALLVHEATHARIRQAGIKYSAASIPRVERICLRNEISFLERVPGSAGLATVKRERLRAQEPSPG